LNGGNPVTATHTAVYQYDYTSDSEPDDIDWIESVAWSVGGADEVTSLGGADIILGGQGDDILKGGNGDNVVFGDNGRIKADPDDLGWFAGGAVFAGAAKLALKDVSTTAPGIGGNDTITTENDDDLIFGGYGDTDDIIDSGNGFNIVIGD